MAQHLRLKRTRTSSSVVSINESTYTTLHVVNTIKSRVTDYSLDVGFFYILSKLTTNISLMIVAAFNLELSTGLSLANPVFDTPHVIDMVLGLEIFLI